MKKKLLFVSQDQGSGNALFLVIKKLSKDKNTTIRVFASKHSKKVFRDQGIPYTDLDDRDFNKELDLKPDLIITGASMRNCIEKEALFFARTNRIKSVTILDFWSNYWQRFTTTTEKDITFLPDYIFVMDNIAKDHMISKGFPENKLIITGNPYFDTFGIPDIREENLNYGSILYISQPEYQNGYYQSDLRPFEDLLDIASRVDQKINIIIRLHPKDEPNAFSEYHMDNLMVDRQRNIAHLIRDSDIVVGKNSSVLFEAVFRGKLVISYQPIIEKPDRLITNQLGLSYLVRSNHELQKILKKAINKQLKKKKLVVLKYYNDSKCTERVIKNIKNILF